MSIFDEDECGNIGEEVLGISAFEILSVIKAPQKMKPQLHNLYFNVWAYFTKTNFWPSLIEDTIYSI